MSSVNMIKLAGWLGYRKFVKASRSPQAAQAKVWQEILPGLRQGKFWSKALGKNSSPTLNDFDISTYQTYAQSIEESGKTGVSDLTAEPVIFWALSSGTSGKNKVFPITATYRQQFQRTTLPSVYRMFQQYPGFLKKPFLFFAFPGADRPLLAGKEVGFISNYNYRHMPKGMLKKYAFPLEIMTSGEVFADWYPLYALRQDLSAMAAITPRAILGLVHAIEQNSSQLLDYLSGKMKIPSRLPQLDVSSQRLAHLRVALKRPRINFREIWPGLEFIACWKSSVCALQLKCLEPYLAELPVFEGMYSATEGWVNVPLGTSVGAPVHPGAHVFEFCPAGETPSAQKLIPLWELEVGREYEIFLTTAMGFVRYRLGDVIKCTGHFHHSPVIEFVQKAGDAISLGDVKLDARVLIEAMNQYPVAENENWSFGPNQQGDGLILYHKGAKKLGDDYISNIESALRKSHSEYNLVTKSRLIQPLKECRLPERYNLGELGNRGELHAQLKQKVIIHHHVNI